VTAVVNLLSTVDAHDRLSDCPAIHKHPEVKPAMLSSRSIEETASVLKFINEFFELQKDEAGGQAYRAAMAYTLSEMLNTLGVEGEDLQDAMERIEQLGDASLIDSMDSFLSEVTEAFER
jgi:hypothetical protein